MNKSTVIAIDGPSGSGKSSITKDVAKKLRLLYVDTGAMFRAIGYLCNENHIKFEESADLQSFLDNLKLTYAKDENVLIEANGRNLSEVIREHSVSTLASKVSTLQPVRNFLLDFQRSIPKNRLCIMEGRDIGTVVFPDAFCKIFLTASSEVRALRRLKQLQAQGEMNHTLDEIKNDVILRDRRDMEREVAPLKQAEDAYLLDTSDLNYEQVIEKMCVIIQQKAQEYQVKI